MMNGKPQTLTSKFKISYNLLLNLLDIGDHHLVQFASRSMITCDLDKQMGELYAKLQKTQTELDNMRHLVERLRTPIDSIREYIDLQPLLKTAVNKKRKELERKINQLTDTHKHIVTDTHCYHKIAEKENELQSYQTQYNQLQRVIS